MQCIFNISPKLFHFGILPRKFELFEIHIDVRTRNDNSGRDWHNLKVLRLTL
jgi:hypothetical protein